VIGRFPALLTGECERAWVWCSLEFKFAVQGIVPLTLPQWINKWPNFTDFVRRYLEFWGYFYLDGHLFL
jgi:hypothetical protein